MAIMNAVYSHAYKSCADSFSFLLAIYLGMKLLGGMETVWVLRNCQATFHSGYKGDSAFSTHSRAYYLSFTTAILVEGKWCFTVGLICSSLAILSSPFMVPMFIFSGETATRFLCLFPKLNNFCLFVIRVLHIYRFLSGRWFINIFSYSVGLSHFLTGKHSATKLHPQSTFLILSSETKIFGLGAQQLNDRAFAYWVQFQVLQKPNHNSVCSATGLMHSCSGREPRPLRYITSPTEF